MSDMATQYFGAWSSVLNMEIRNTCGAHGTYIMLGNMGLDIMTHNKGISNDDGDKRGTISALLSQFLTLPLMYMACANQPRPQ